MQRENVASQILLSSYAALSVINAQPGIGTLGGHDQKGDCLHRKAGLMLQPLV